ncbi:MAG: hypothetical protein ACLFTS_02550 [Candidatus Paceibacterota bacterium]
MSENVARKEVGYVVEVKNYLLTIRGLPSIRVNDIIVDDQGRKAVVHALSESSVEALVLDNRPVNPGTEFFIDNSSAGLNLSYDLKGKVVNALGEVVSQSSEDNGKPLRYQDTPTELAFDVVAKNIDARDFIKKQLVTGLALVDCILPVGKGQRELVYGPIHSGKGEFLRDIVISQKKQGNVCIYTAIGKPSTFTSRLIRALREADALDETIIVSALSDEPTPMITIAPSTAFLIAEYFCNKGEDVVLILDDLGIHAKYIREAALLSGQFPGRESYPGDIFYQHAHLMERSGSFNEKQGNGTITLFPVLETDVESFTNIIPTNLMGSTDGHFFFSTEMHTEGFKPSISILQSVTRVGRMTHNKIQRELSTKLMDILSEYPRQQEYSRFGTQMSKRTREILKKGRVIYELLNQNNTDLMPVSMQIMMLSLVFTSFFDSDDNDVDMIRAERLNILETLGKSKSFSGARDMIRKGEADLDSLISEMEKGVEELNGQVQSGKKKDTDAEKEKEQNDKKAAEEGES